jgi:hypothetical protein
VIDHLTQPNLLLILYDLVAAAAAKKKSDILQLQKNRP